MRLSKFAQDVNKAENGVWVTLGDGLKVKVARNGSARGDAVLKRLYKPYQKQLTANTMPDSLSEQLNLEYIAEAFVLGWEGLLDDNDAEIPYTKEKALEIISDPAYRDFKDPILALSRDAETFRKDAIAATVGKSAAA